MVALPSCHTHDEDMLACSGIGRNVNGGIFYLLVYRMSMRSQYSCRVSREQEDAATLAPTRFHCPLSGFLFETGIGESSLLHWIKWSHGWSCLNHFPAIFDEIFDMAPISMPLATVTCIYESDMSHVT